MMTEKLISKSAGCIIDAVRNQRGRLSFVSDEAQVNRQYFNHRMFRTLRFFQIIRVLYRARHENGTRRVHGHRTGHVRKNLGLCRRL